MRETNVQAPCDSETVIRIDALAEQENRRRRRQAAELLKRATKIIARDPKLAEEIGLTEKK